MKLQNEVAFASEKLNALIERKGIEFINTYILKVYNSHEWKNFEVRIANDVVKYGALGIANTCALIERNPGTTDEHVTTLCINVMKKAGLLPFNPDNLAEKKAEKINTPTADRVARESLEWRTTNELARLKAALNSEWEKAHAAGLYDVAARVSEQTGRISNEQARRLQARADSIPEGVGVYFTDGEIWSNAVFGFAVYDDLMKGYACDDFNYFATVGEAVAFCRANYPRTPFEVYAIKRADAINSTEGALLRTVYTRRRVGRRLVDHQPACEIIPDNVAILAEEYTPAELAAFLTNDEKKADELARTLTRYELAVLVDKTNDEDPDNTPTTGEKSGEGTTQAPTTDNAPTSPAKGEGEAVGDFCPLTGCNLTDDEARALLACYSTSEKSGEATTLQTAGEIKPDKNRAPRLAPVAACVLYLLSLTIGNGKPATMYTDDPAAVVAQVTEAGETLTAYEWHPVPTPDALPPYDVPALA